MIDPAGLLLIQATAREIRVAHLDADGRVEDLAVEETRSAPLTGNVYLARVRRVVPGMGAAFVEIGAERTAYLPLGERGGLDAAGAARIERGSDVVVQVGRDGFGGKGARVTTRLQLVGRHLVLLADADTVTIARRIEASEERDRLTRVLREALPPGRGAIARSAARGAPDDAVAAEARHLAECARRIEERGRTGVAPLELWAEPSLALREIRDHLGVTAAEVIVDASAELVEDIREHARTFRIADSDGRIRRHDDPVPLLRQRGVERELTRALSREVPLPRGGSLAIDGTEAATLVDVNTGRYVGRSDLEQTVLDTNLEAAEELARQARLRNLGGLVLVDFIDMKSAANRKLVLARLEEAFRGDPAPIRISGFTDAGMVEITRGRSRPTLAELLTESCPTCGGTGHVPKR